MSTKGFVGTVEGFSKSELVVRLASGEIRRIFLSGTTSTAVAKAEGLTDLTQLVGRSVRVSADESEFFFFDSVVPESQKQDYKGPAKLKQSPNDQGLSFEAGVRMAIKQTYPGGYVTLVQESDSVTIKLTKDGKEFLADARSEGDHGEVYWAPDWDTVFTGLLEPLVVDSDWEILHPEEVGGLTSAPILGYDTQRDDSTNDLLHVEHVYWYPDYQVLDPLDMLYKEGEVVFPEAPEDKTPEEAHEASRRAKSKDNWMQEAMPEKTSGALHKALGVSKDHKFTIAELEGHKKKLSQKAKKGKLTKAELHLEKMLVSAINAMRSKKGSLTKSARKADIYWDGELVGTVDLTEEEALHFSNAPTCAAGVVLTPFEMEWIGLNPDQQVQVDVLDGPERQGGKSKKATGEPDQDYDHEFFDEIVKQLNAAYFQNVIHREFDKYQGVYLWVGDLRETFWMTGIFYTGKKQPGSESEGGVFTFQPGKTEHCIFTPEGDNQESLDVTQGPDGTVDASHLVNYCRNRRRQMLKEQGFKRAPGKQAKTAFQGEDDPNKKGSLRKKATDWEYYQGDGENGPFGYKGGWFVEWAPGEDGKLGYILTSEDDGEPPMTDADVEIFVDAWLDAQYAAEYSKPLQDIFEALSPAVREASKRTSEMPMGDDGSRNLVEGSGGVFEVIRDEDCTIEIFDVDNLKASGKTDQEIDKTLGLMLQWAQSSQGAIVTVVGGVPEVYYAPEGVSITIIDHDNDGTPKQGSSRRAEAEAPIAEYPNYESRDEKVQLILRETFEKEEVGESTDTTGRPVPVYDYTNTAKQLAEQYADEDNWSEFLETFQDMLNELNPQDLEWHVEGTNLNWRGSSGSMDLSTNNAEDLLRKVSPVTDCHYRAYQEEAGFKLIIYSHDVPTGSVLLFALKDTEDSTDHEGSMGKRRVRVSKVRKGIVDVSNPDKLVTRGRSTASSHFHIAVVDPEGQDHYDAVLRAIKEVVLVRKKADPQGYLDAIDSSFPTLCLEVAGSLGAQFREEGDGTCIFDFSKAGSPRSWIAGQKKGGLFRRSFKTLEDLVHSQPSNSTYFVDGEGLTGIPNTRGKILWYRWTQEGYSLAGSTDTPEGAQEKKLPVRKAKRGTPDGVGLGKGSYEDILDALHKKGDTEDPEALAAWIFHKNTGHWPGEKANRPKKRKGSEPFYRIQPSDVGKVELKAFGGVWPTAPSIRSEEVGKRVFLREGTLVVEEEQSRSHTAFLDDDFADERPTCPMCGGPGNYLGTLGTRAHFRCENCGMDFSHLVESEPSVYDPRNPSQDIKDRAEALGWDGSTDPKEYIELNSHQRNASDPIWSGAEEARQWLVEIKAKVTAPYLGGYVSSLGGDRRSSVLLTISGESKEKWHNGILENSPFAKVHLTYDGALYTIVSSVKWRKTHVSTVAQAISKLQILADRLSYLGSGTQAQSSRGASREKTAKKSYSVIVSPSMKAFWSNQYGWVKFVEDATKFPFTSSDLNEMPPTEDGDAQWMPLEQAEKLVFGPKDADARKPRNQEAWEEYTEGMPYPTHMATHNEATGPQGHIPRELHAFGFSESDIELLLTYHGGMSSSLYSVGSRLYSFLLDLQQGRKPEIEPFTTEDIQNSIHELDQHRVWLQAHPGEQDSGSEKELDYLIGKLKKIETVPDSEHVTAGTSSPKDRAFERWLFNAPDEVMKDTLEYWAHRKALWNLKKVSLTNDEIRKLITAQRVFLHRGLQEVYQQKVQQYLGEEKALEV